MCNEQFAVLASEHATEAGHRQFCSQSEPRKRFSILTLI